MYCKHCGKEIAEDSKYCNFCGNEIDGKNELIKSHLSRLNNKYTYIYVLWLALHYYLYLFGGGGFSYTRAGYFETYEANAHSFLYPNAPKDFAFSIELYDITDFLFYVVIVPVVLFVIYKLYRILKQKKA